MHQTAPITGFIQVIGAFLALLCLTTCSKETIVNVPQLDERVFGNWLFTGYVTPGDSTISTDTSSATTLSLSSDGRFSGSIGCYPYSGVYHYQADGVLHIDSTWVLSLACFNVPLDAERYWADLRAMNSLSASATALTIRCGDRRGNLTFIRQ